MKLPAFRLACWLLGASWLASPTLAESITVATGKNAPPPVQFAADELVSYLGRMFPEDEFSRAVWPASAGKSVVLALADEKAARGVAVPGPGGYRIKRVKSSGADQLLVVADRPEAMPHAAYALLGKLGCAFGFGEEAVPEPRPEGSLDFAAGETADRPLARDRYIFNWHNFLSSCTGWSEADWVAWITAGAKCGYNGIMLHCYPNNPMIPGGYQGAERPVGYLATTRQGRDWSVPHVNDVRRLPGAEGVFDGPVFGCREVVVMEGRSAREQARVVRAMMGRVFAAAKRRGMKVHLAIDCDLARANPREMLEKLPASARFKVPYQGLGWLMDPQGDVWLERPDTPEGYAFIKEQARQLLETYPQLDEINFWRRASGSLVSQLKRDHLPAEWRAEFDQKLATLPELPKGMADQHAWNFFLAKRIAAWKHACTELGHPRLGFATGSWRPYWVASAASWLAPETRLMMLDSEISRGPKNSLRYNPALGDQIAKLVQPRGRFVPIIWAHHDDGEYVGAHLKPYPKFADRLHSWNADSFALIHWLPQLHDRFLQHHIRQVWQATKNEPYPATVRWWNRHRFPESIAARVEALELDRLATLPAFGRETTGHFIDRPLSRYLRRYPDLTPKKVIAAANRRQTAFAELAKTSDLLPSAREALAYQTAYEKFCAEMWATQLQVEQINEALKKGDRAKAVVMARKLDPAVPLRAYGNMLRHGLDSQSARGLFVSMSLRWWPDIVDLRQQLGVEAVRFQFAPTRHEPLAFMRGNKTWWIDRDTRLWRTLGEQETGAKVFTRRKAPACSNPSYAEIGRDGLTDDKKLVLKLGTLHGKPLAAGRYRLVLLISRPDEATGPIRFHARAEIHQPAPARKNQSQPATKPTKTPPLSVVLDREVNLPENEDQLHLIETAIALPHPAKLELTFTPETGPVALSGIRITPVEQPPY